MSVEQVLSKLNDDPRVIGAFAMKRIHRLLVEVEESRVRASGGVRYENRGLANIRRRDIAVCVFSRGFLDSPSEAILTLEDDDGTVCGELVPRGMRKEYEDRGGVWVTDDFIVYPEIVPVSEPHFVIVPHRMDLGTEQGVRNVSAFNPAMSTDEMLKNEFGIRQSSRITSTIMTMDRLDGPARSGVAEAAAWGFWRSSRSCAGPRTYRGCSRSRRTSSRGSSTSRPGPSPARACRC